MVLAVTCPASPWLSTTQGEEKERPVKPLLSLLGSQSKITKKGYHRIESPEAWKVLWARHNTGAEQPEERHPAAIPYSKEQVQANYGKLPLSFEANVGQADASVQFLAHGSGYGLYLTGMEAVMVLSQPAADPVGRVSNVSNPSGGDRTGFQPILPTQATTSATVVRMEVLGGNEGRAGVGQDPLSGKVNYFVGNAPAQWHTHISTFAKVEYQNVYPGINLDYYGHQGQLEYDFVVAPGADPRVIHLGFRGASSHVWSRATKS